MAGSRPTQRTRAQLKKMGVESDIVEKWIPQARRRRDVAGCIDVLAYGPAVGVLGIQCSRGGDHASHRTKALAEPRLRDWLMGGGRFEIWSWSKLASGRWTLRRERLLFAGKAPGGSIVAVPV